jgi:hypothetical protein
VQIPNGSFPSGTIITQVAAGSGFSLARSSVGSIFGWGDDESGQLGNASFADQLSPVAVVAPPGVTYASVSAGSDFSEALTSAGAVDAWGNNDLGQLGDGFAATCNDGDPNSPTDGCSNIPVPIFGPPNTPFVAVAAGNTQGYALTAGGRAWSWGGNFYGQLGNADASQTSIGTPFPMDQPAGTNAAALYSGSQASFGLLVTGVDQSISGFPATLDKTYGLPTFPLGATASSGLAVTLSTTTPTVCTTAGTLVTIAGAGLCTLTGSQIGSNVFNPAPPVTMTYTFGQAPLNIGANDVTSTQGNIPSFTYTLSGFVNQDTAATAGLTGTPSCTTTATASSPSGTYPITCTAGSLAAPNYEITTLTGGTLTLLPAIPGYHLVASDGGIFSFGGAPFFGSAGGISLVKPIVGMGEAPGGGGYWEVASDGGIFSYGNAGFYGSMGGKSLNKPIVGMAADPTNGGYWEVASDGGIFSFGGAQFYGSTGAIRLNAPIVGMASTPDGGGYWLVATDGGIFAFGDAPFYGSTGSIHLNKPIVGMGPAANGGGYWLVASDGGIFTFGSAQFFGSAGGLSLASPVVGMLVGPAGDGYWLAAANGAVYSFGTGFFGSLVFSRLNAPITGVG